MDADTTSNLKAAEFVCSSFKRVLPAGRKRVDAPPVSLIGPDQALGFKRRDGGVDTSGRRPVGRAKQAAKLGHEFVAVHRLPGQQGKHDQMELPVLEESASHHQPFRLPLTGIFVYIETITFRSISKLLRNARRALRGARLGLQSPALEPERGAEIVTWRFSKEKAVDGCQGLQSILTP